ncbi:polysaccharide deacetylase family protein [Uliginosibacterium sp. H3]|uniref:Polysaccharide deacetylase family protein n=1 Tax=Uliginosibacterium silvisoli TaxID=3114758 RepID=A0ABU6K7U5_9RHOO|nr:polysaccharide deacetylase family protein [Uliginosibacterium sp. H3]
MPPATWRPTPFLQASLAIHGGAIAVAATTPSLMPWALTTLLLDHALVAATGLWPRSTWLGPNMLRLPEAAAVRGEVWITIDDGPDPRITPKVLEILERHRARASFFCIGKHVTAHAGLAREIVAAGHCIENHSEQHRHNFSVLGPRAMNDEIARAQDSIENATGRRPRYFRAPAGLRNPFLDYVLHKQGLQLVSWTRRGFDTREGDAEVVMRRLTRDLAGGDILLLHDAHAARTTEGRPVVLDVLPRLLERLAAERLTTVTL